MNVAPLKFDITAHLSLSSTNTIEYAGYFNGSTPNPTENPGYILMYSWISFYYKI